MDDEDCDFDGEACGVCGESLEEDADTMACDGCDQGFHLACLGLRAIPVKEWLCFDCMEGSQAG
ncbi:PHD and ring finger domains 1, partial [Haematococcus lacustris]